MYSLVVTNNYYITVEKRRWCIRSYMIWEVRPISKYFPLDWYVKLDGKNTRILPISIDQDKILDELLIVFNKQRVSIPIITKYNNLDKEDTFITNRFHILDL